MLWEFIKSIRYKEKYINNYNLLTNMYEKLNMLSDDKLIILVKDIDNLKFNTNLYDFLFENKLINSSSDFVCFRIWLIFQGEYLYKCINKYGNIKILDYIKKYNIPSSEYKYESLYYPIMEELENRNIID